MRAALKSSSTPGGYIHVVATGYNWQSSTGESREPKKKCAWCDKDLPILDFLVKETMVKRHGMDYLLYHDDPSVSFCRRCHHAVNTDFHLHYVGRELRIRTLLRDLGGVPYRLWDPKDRMWGAIDQRGVRCMSRTPPVELRFQPRRDRQESMDGKPYANRR